MCEAFTTRNRFCKETIVEGTPLCRHHQKAFEKSDWLNRFLYHPRDSLPVLLGYAPKNRYGKLEHHIRHVTTHYIPLTKEDAEALPALPLYTDLYRLLSENPNFDPNWNVKLLYLCFREFLMRRQETFRGLWESPYVFLKPFFDHPKLGLQACLFILVNEMKKVNRSNHLAPGFRRVDFDAILDELFNQGTEEQLHQVYLIRKKFLYISPDYLMNVFNCKDEVSKEFFLQHVYPFLQQQKQEIRHRMKHSLAPIKEEIVASVYHPRHVARWLETGGWEMLDMMF